QRQALRMMRVIYGERHPQTARLRSAHGSTLRWLGRPEEAERHLRAALAVERPLFGDSHRFVYASLTSLADALRQQGRYAESEAVLRDIIPSIPQPLQRGIALGSLASLLREKGDLTKAAQAQQQTVAYVRE